jgi:hypothetical protein
LTGKNRQITFCLGGDAWKMIVKHFITSSLTPHFIAEASKQKHWEGRWEEKVFDCGGF